MIEIVLHRSLSQDIASSDVRQEEQGDISLGWQGKSAAFGRAHVVGGVEVLGGTGNGHAVAILKSSRNQRSREPSAYRKFAVKTS